MSGTSMSAPNVAGVAALLRAQEPWISTEQVRRRLVATGAETTGGSIDRRVDSFEATFNGSFEAGLDGWATTGDVRTVRSLADIRPQLGRRMALISNGPGAVTVNEGSSGNTGEGGAGTGAGGTAAGDGEVILLAEHRRAVPPEDAQEAAGEGAVLVPGSLEEVWSSWGPTAGEPPPPPEVPDGYQPVLFWDPGRGITALSYRITSEGVLQLVGVREAPGDGCVSTDEVGGRIHVVAVAGDVVSVGMETAAPQIDEVVVDCPVG